MPEDPTDRALLRALSAQADHKALSAEFPGLTRERLDAFFQRIARLLPPEAARPSAEAQEAALVGCDELVLYTDGGSRGNPGPAGCGAVLANGSGKVVREMSEYIGHATSNEAEYTALLLGLDAARAAGARRIRVRADSELLVRQITGQYKVKSAKLAPLFRRAMALLGGFEGWRAEHIPRSRNAEADRLANEAMDRGVS